MFKARGLAADNLCIVRGSSTLFTAFPPLLNSGGFSSSIFAGFFQGFINAFLIRLTLVCSGFSTLSTHKTIKTILNKLISKTGEL